MTISLPKVAAVVSCCLGATVAQAADVPAGPNTRAVVPLREVYQGEFTFPNDGDWIRARVVNGRTYAARVATIPDASDRGGKFLKVFDRNRRLIATATSVLQDSQGLEFQAPLTGDVFLAVNAGSIDIDSGTEPGSYPYTVTYDDDCPGTVSTRCALTLGTVSSGCWTWAEDSDWREIDLVRGRTYELTKLTGSFYGSQFRIRDFGGAELASVPGEDVTSVRFTAKYSGRYYVDAAFDGDEGDFSPNYRYRLTRVGAATAVARP